MHYSYTCPHCGKVFYTYNEDKEVASKTLYDGIEEHMKEFKESEDASFYHEPTEDTNKIYSEMAESTDAPPGGYEL